MAFTIPSSEPDRFRLGDSVSWTKSLPDYLPGDGWTLSYAFVSSSDQQTVTASDNGDGTHLVEMAPAVSELFTAGTYDYQAIVAKAGEEHLVERGTLEVLANFADESGGYDGRSHAAKMVDLLEAALQGDVSTVASYTISTPQGSRSLGRMSQEELLNAWRWWRSQLVREERRKRTEDGKGHRGIIKAVL